MIKNLKSSHKSVHAISHIPREDICYLYTPNEFSTLHEQYSLGPGRLKGYN